MTQAMETRQSLIHASTVVMDGRAVLLRGQPGCGKSDLALRLLDRGARLLADDQTQLDARNGDVWATCPPTISGWMEVRGVGLVSVPGAVTAAESFPVALVVELVTDPALVARLPDDCVQMLLGMPVPSVQVFGFAASAVLTVQVALDAVLGRREKVN